MKLSTRVGIAVTMVTAVALLASFIAVEVLVSHDETDDLDRALFLQAHAFADRTLLRDQINLSVQEGLAAVPEALAATARFVVIYDEHREPVSFSDNLRGEVPTFESLGLAEPLHGNGEALDVTTGTRVLRGVVLPIPSRGGHTLLYAAPRTSIDEDLRFLRRAASLIFAAAMLLTLFLARWLSERISRDVAAIGMVARAVAQGDLGARVGSGARGTTETRALGEHMDNMIERLQALVVGQRTFISHAAHELRSPLTAIRGELQLALRRERSPAEYRGAIETALSDVQALTGLAEDLLVLARVQSTSQEHALAPAVSVSDLLAEALRMMRGALEEREVNIASFMEDEAVGDLLVRGPLSDVARALRNLAENAIAHSPEGGTVTVRVEHADCYVILRVLDQGTGIPPSERDHVFQPFYRGSTEDSEGRSGAGLGLSIAREIARNRQGDVLLESVSRFGGCGFQLRLPVVGAVEGSLEDAHLAR